jgi:glycosyltransferase involved in cell wall biosynthesis
MGKKQMNILILSWRGPKHPNAGGAEIATTEHAKYWIKAGHNVTWFTSSFKGAKKYENYQGIEIYRQGNQIFGVHLAAMKWYLFDKKVKFDLVVDQFHGIPFFTPIYVRTKKLAYIHEVTKDVWKYNPWTKPFNLIPSTLGPLFERYIFIFVYPNIPFMTVSESTKKDLVSIGIKKNNISVIINGIKSEKISARVKKEDIPTIMFLGAVAKDKGIYDVIDVFSKLIDSFTKIQFWIVGKAESEIKKDLNRHINKINLKGRVKIWGFVSDKKKFELLKKAHIMINPSIREGWGLVNIEANSMGTPVVGYKVPGMIDSVKKNATGILVNKHDTNTLAQEIVRLLRSKEFIIMSKYCENYAKQFSWEKSGEASLKLISKITNER